MGTDRDAVRGSRISRHTLWLEVNPAEEEGASTDSGSSKSIPLVLTRTPGGKYPHLLSREDRRVRELHHSSHRLRSDG